MPEEQIDSNINQTPIEQTPSKPPAFEGGIDVEKIPIREITDDRERQPTPEIQKTELGKGGLGGISYAQQQEIKHIKEIESIMEKDIEEIYIQMPLSQQIKFKIKGEEIAIKINQLLSKTKFKVKKIIQLIKKWLSVIPGCNKFFLEQSSKIKADEIIKLKEGW